MCVCVCVCVQLPSHIQNTIHLSFLSCVYHSKVLFIQNLNQLV